MDSASRPQPAPRIVNVGAQRTTATEPKAPSLTMLRSHKSEILRVAKAHGASNIRVFGSVARGTATPTSDLDLLVDFQFGRTLVDHVRLWSGEISRHCLAPASTSSALEVLPSATTTSELTRQRCEHEGCLWLVRRSVGLWAPWELAERVHSRERPRPGWRAGAQEP